MQKFKRLAALAGAILLVILYLCTLLFSLMDGALAQGLFMASIYCTVAVPVLLYAIQLIYKALQGRGVPKDPPSQVSTAAGKTDSGNSAINGAAAAGKAGRKDSQKNSSAAAGAGKSTAESKSGSLKSSSPGAGSTGQKGFVKHEAAGKHTGKKK